MTDTAHHYRNYAWASASVGRLSEVLSHGDARGPELDRLSAKCARCAHFPTWK